MDEEKRKTPTPARCRQYLRKAVVAEFEELVEGFLKEARKGSCAHMKLAIEVLRPEPRSGVVATSGKGVMQRLMEQMEREDAERAEASLLQQSVGPRPAESGAGTLVAVGEQVSGLR